MGFVVFFPFFDFYFEYRDKSLRFIPFRFLLFVFVIRCNLFEERIVKEGRIVRERKFASIRLSFFGKLKEICKRIFAGSDYPDVKFSCNFDRFIFNSDFPIPRVFFICLPPVCRTPELYNTKEFPLFWGNMLSDKRMDGVIAF